MDLFLIYLVCFGVGLLFSILSAFAADVFGGHDVPSDVGAGGHAEAGFAVNDMPGFSALSPATIASFVTAFGGLGMIFSKFEATKSAIVSAPLSVLGAFGVAFVVFWLFRTVFHKTQSSSESRVATLVGVPATVLTPIPENGVGEIAYVQLGTRYTAPARAEMGVPILGGQTVKISRVVGTQFFVRNA